MESLIGSARVAIIYRVNSQLTSNDESNCELPRTSHSRLQQANAHPSPSGAHRVVQRLDDSSAVHGTPYLDDFPLVLGRHVQVLGLFDGATETGA